jgi:hypothetical protein
MAITSTGYPLTIAPGGPWANAHRSAGRRYTAETVGACKVTAVSGGTREVSIATGAIAGVGVRDLNDAAVTIALPSSGSVAYYCIVARRRWNDDAGGNRTEFGYVSAGTSRVIPTLARTPGTIDEQPLALVRINVGETAPAEIVDLRLIAEDGGVFSAYSDLALSDAERIGARVRVISSGLTYERVATTGGGAAWVRSTVGGGLIAVHEGAFADLAHSGAQPGGFVRVWGSPSPQSQSANIASVSIPDPGVPYRVAFDVRGWIGTETDPNTRWDHDFMVGSVVTDLRIVEGAAMLGGNASPSYARRKEWTSIPSTETFTGAQTAVLRARRILGTDYGALLWDNWRFRVAVHEA